VISKLAHSLSLRLLVIFLLLAVIFTYGTVVATRWVFSTDQLRELVNGHLSLHIDYVKRDIGSPPNLENALLLTEKIPVDIRVVGEGVNWASVPEFPEMSELDFGGIDSVSFDSRQWLGGLEDITFSSTATHKFLKLIQDDYSIIVSSPKMADKNYSRPLLPLVIFMGVITILGSYFAVRTLFGPIQGIREGAEKIGRGNFSHRIANTRKDELGDLAQDINDMASEVEGMLEAKRQLLLGISHELRSPLSRMTLALEIMPENEFGEPLKNDIQEMEKIIETLLEAERLNERHAALTLTRVAGRSLVDEMIADYFLDKKHHIRINIPEDYWLTVDEARTALMLKNLVSNALRYIDPGSGYVELEFSKSNTSWLLAVRDNGVGYPADQVSRIGEPFFRAESSRTREKGDIGLGLYLTKSIAAAHGGSLTLDQSWSSGACFVVEIPFEPSVKNAAGTRRHRDF